MGIQRTILERLRDPDPAGQRPLHAAPAEIQESILDNLRHLLNTCQGNCLIDPDYGLPHLTTVRNTMPGSLKKLEAAIRATIEKHEPRLSQLRVRHQPHSDAELELRFEISGLIADEDWRTPVRFETYADDEGHMIVR